MYQFYCFLGEFAVLETHYWIDYEAHSLQCKRCGLIAHKENHDSPYTIYENELLTCREYLMKAVLE